MMVLYRIVDHRITRLAMTLRLLDADQTTGPGEVAPGQFAPICRYLIVPRGQAGYLCAAVGHLMALVLLFQPWLTASGDAGGVRVNAFGRMWIPTSPMGLPSQSPPQPARIDIDPSWAQFSCVALVVACAITMFTVRARSTVLPQVAAGFTLAVSVLVVYLLIYVDSKAGALSAMVGPGSLLDPGTQIGPVHIVSYSTARLTAAAMFACGISLASAVATVAQRLASKSYADADSCA